jgi:hypothetical protein
LGYYERRTGSRKDRRLQEQRHRQRTPVSVFAALVPSEFASLRSSDLAQRSSSTPWTRRVVFRVG